MDAPPIVGEEHAFDHTTVDVDGVRLSVVDDGPRDAEETLLFIHGNPTWSFLWRRALQAGIAAGHRVVAPDHAGFGRSDKPVDPAYHNLERHVTNLETVAEELELDGCTVVMHDWGGPIGMGLATRQTDRVRRLVVANTVAFAPSKQRSMSMWHRLLATGPGYWLGRKMNLVEATAMRFGVRRPLPRRVKHAYDWPFEHEGARIAAARLVQMVPDGPDHPEAATLRGIQDQYPDIQDIPMRILWADGDPVFPPKFAERWTRDFPDAQVSHVSEWAGHFWQEDDPEPFIDGILGFVAGKA